MAKVAIVTDTTAFMPEEMTKNYPIHFVPLQVIWGEETLQDLKDIQPTEFYTRLESSKITPTTSQPSPARFIEIYQKLLNEGYEIVSAHISSKLSGTLDSAIQARQHFPGAPIELVDSLTTSLGLGFPVLAAARAAANGATLMETKTMLEQNCKNTGILFAVATLEYLRRGGRIGGAQAFLGTALSLKPILELRDGRIEAIERVRTMNKTIDRLIDLFDERIGHRRPLHIGALHAKAPEEARVLLERVRERFPASDISQTALAEVSPVIGTHTGPGVLGLAFMIGD